MKRMLSAFFLFSLACAQAGSTASLESELSALAEQISVLPPKVIIYERFLYQGEDLTATEPALKKFVDLSHSLRKDPSAAVPLLQHNDPKIRSLAMSILFDAEKPEFLPLIHKLTKDTSPTFPTIKQDDSAIWMRGRENESQTVGMLATSYLDFMLMERKGEDFETVRKERQQVAGLTVDHWERRLDRASSSSLPVQDEREPLIDTVWDEIRREPEPRVHWLMLWLGAMWHQKGMMTNGKHPTTGPSEEEIIKSVQKLPREQLLGFLADAAINDDPSMQLKQMNNWPNKRAKIFLLKHADRFFEEKDSAKLLKMEVARSPERTIDPFVSGWWAVAAANLDPANASTILKSAILRYNSSYQSDERALIASTLCNLSGKTETPYLIEWFFTEPIEVSSFPHARAKFLINAGNTKNIEMLHAIVADPRFEKLEWQSLARFVRVANSLNKMPIVSNEEFESAWHPLGEGHYESEKEQARKDYPVETKALEESLARWRNSLRAWAEPAGEKVGG